MSLINPLRYPHTANVRAVNHYRKAFIECSAYICKAGFRDTLVLQIPCLTGGDQHRNLPGVSLDLAGEASADQLQVTNDVNTAGTSRLLFLNLVSSVLIPRLHRQSARCQKLQCSPCKVTGFHALEIQ